MLDKHLIAKTAPIANKENIVHWKNYRVTVLADRLFRIERSENCRFRDAATQVVWFRNMEKQHFAVTEGDTEASIKTHACKIILKEAREDCRIELNGNLLPISNDENLKGTYRTLDKCNGNEFTEIYPKKVTDVFDNGVCSRSGVAVLEDSHSLTLSQDGMIREERADGTDEYVFAFGNDYRAAVQALYTITGKTPLIPRFALGNWWSRYHKYTENEYLRLMNKFEEREVPLTVATVDMDWHWSDFVNDRFQVTASGRNTPHYLGTTYEGTMRYMGWTGYSWNTDLFPDYKRFLKALKAKNLKVTLNLHPACGVRYFEDMYAEMAAAMGRDPATEEQIPFDMTDPCFINNYFKLLHKPYEADGVTFWWIDWQQGTASKTQGLDPLWSLNHYHTLDNAKNHALPLVLSRYAGAGSHRYPLGFSGDTHITWETLDFLPYFTANATNVGYTWWSHDIGGFGQGAKDNEMFLRHVQFGVFSPITRLHNSSLDVVSKEPWLYDNGTGHLVEEWLRLRHKLIPYLYSASYRTHRDGRALIEPLYYEWDTPLAYQYKNQYLFGDQLLVIPITQKSHADGFSRVRAWIPEGTWTDIFTGDQYVIPQGGAEKTLIRSLNSIPVLARSGAVLPLSRDKGNSVANPTELDVCIFTGNGSFTLYEDGLQDGDSALATTVFKTSYKETQGCAVQTVSIEASGECSVIPANRKLRMLFKNLDWDKTKITVFENGKPLSLAPCLTDSAAVEFPFSAACTYRIEARFTPKSELERLKDRALHVLLHSEYHNNAKTLAWRELLAIDDLAKFVFKLERSPYLSPLIVERILEDVRQK